MRPATPRLHELRRIRMIADYQFGRGASKMFPDATQITRSPRTHKPRYVFKDNKQLATLRARDGFLALTVDGGQALRKLLPPPRLRVRVFPEIEEFIGKGGNVFAKHVATVDPELRPEEEVLVVGRRDRLLAVGTCRLNAEEMRSFTIGMAVKVRHGVEQA